jgi:selenide,water dikinase
MARGSGCVVELDVAAIPLLSGALELVDGNTPGGGRTNLEHFGPGVSAGPGLDSRRVQLLYDPQTSGGLLVSLSSDAAGAALEALRSAGVAAHQVGTIGAPSSTSARVVLR